MLNLRMIKLGWKVAVRLGVAEGVVCLLAARWPAMGFAGCYSSKKTMCSSSPEESR